MAKVNDFQMFVPSLCILMINVKICSSQEQEEEQNLDNTTVGYDYDGNTVDYTMYAHTLCEKKDVIKRFRLWFIPLSCTIVFLLGLFGNSLVIFTSLHFRRLKTMTDVYLLNLAFADLLFTLTLPLWAANFLGDWALGLFTCKAMYTLHKVTLYSSTLLLSCISVDRYFAITKAVSAHLHRTKTAHLSKLSLGVIWALALGFSVPEMRYTGIRHGTCSPYPVDNTSSLLVGVQSTQIALGFVVPLLVMTFCYSAVAVKLCQSRGFERSRALKVILAVVAAFLCCQVPYTLYLFVSTLNPSLAKTGDCAQQRALLYANDVTQFLAVYRCCLNPLVYGFIGVKFRQDLLKLMKEGRCLSHEQFYKCSSHSGRKSSVADTETTTTFSP
ncbi:unnamed protein product [Arctogadus glacialis]